MHSVLHIKRDSALDAIAALLGLASVVAERGQVVLGDHAKRANRCLHPGLGAVDVVDAVAVPDWFPFAATRQVEVNT